MVGIWLAAFIAVVVLIVWGGLLLGNWIMGDSSIPQDKVKHTPTLTPELSKDFKTNYSTGPYVIQPAMGCGVWRITDLFGNVLFADQVTMEHYQSLNEVQFGIDPDISVESLKMQQAHANAARTNDIAAQMKDENKPGRNFVMNEIVGKPEVVVDGHAVQQLDSPGDVEPKENLPSRHMKVRSFSDKFTAKAFEAGEIRIREKIDGSQIGFGKDPEGRLWVRSRGKILVDPLVGTVDRSSGFGPAIDYIESIKNKINPDEFFYGEYLSRPHHGKIKYDRVPNNHIVIFESSDFDRKEFYSYDMRAEYMGFETAKEYDLDKSEMNMDGLKKAMDEAVPMLGGERVEGLVLKNYGQSGHEGQDRGDVDVLSMKIVQEDFREVKVVKAKGIDAFIERFSTHQRYEKALQHLKEAGELDGTDADIGRLCKEVIRDTREEESHVIEPWLDAYANKAFNRGLVKDVPAWLKKIRSEQHA